MTDRIPNLLIEITDGGGFLLEQDSSGNVDRIELHPTQVSHLAELAGLLRRHDHYTPPASVLARRLRVLLARINQLDDWLRVVADNGREDLDHECTYSFATWEMATDFCADLVDAPTEPDGICHATPMADAISHAGVPRATSAIATGRRDVAPRPADLFSTTAP